MHRKIYLIFVKIIEFLSLNNYKSMKWKWLYWVSFHKRKSYTSIIKEPNDFVLFITSFSNPRLIIIQREKFRLLKIRRLYFLCIKITISSLTISLIFSLQKFRKVRIKEILLIHSFIKELHNFNNKRTKWLRITYNFLLKSKTFNYLKREIQWF